MQYTYIARQKKSNKGCDTSVMGGTKNESKILELLETHLVQLVIDKHKKKSNEKKTMDERDERDELHELDAIIKKEYSIEDHFKQQFHQFLLPFYLKYRSLLLLPSNKNNDTIVNKVTYKVFFIRIRTLCSTFRSQYTTFLENNINKHETTIMMDMKPEQLKYLPTIEYIKNALFQSKNKRPSIPTLNEQIVIDDCLINFSLPLDTIVQNKYFKHSTDYNFQTKYAVKNNYLLTYSLEKRKQYAIVKNNKQKIEENTQEMQRKKQKRMHEQDQEQDQELEQEQKQEELSPNNNLFVSFSSLWKCLCTEKSDALISMKRLLLLMTE